MKKFTTILNFDFSAREVAKFNEIVYNYTSQIIIIYEGREANAKSLLGLFDLKIKKGAVLSFGISGSDEGDARDVIEKFFREKRG